MGALAGGYHGSIVREREAGHGVGVALEKELGVALEVLDHHGTPEGIENDGLARMSN